MSAESDLSSAAVRSVSGGRTGPAPQSSGIRVPEALSMVGFGDLALSQDLEPALTTVRIDGGEIGRLAAACILDPAEHEARHGQAIDLGFEIIERGSA